MGTAEAAEKRQLRSLELAYRAGPERSQSDPWGMGKLKAG